MFLYKATLNRVVSPVTISCHIDLGFGITKTEAIRLNGVALPLTSEDRAKAVGIIDDWVNRHPVFVLSTYKNKEKFGRFLGVLMDRHGGTLNKALLEAHVTEPIPECEIPEDEPDEPEVEGIEVAPEELPEVEEEAETPSPPTEPEGEAEGGGEDLLEDVDDADLQEEVEVAKKERKRWRLKRSA